MGNRGRTEAAYACAIEESGQTTCRLMQLLPTWTVTFLRRAATIDSFIPRPNLCSYPESNHKRRENKASPNKYRSGGNAIEKSQKNLEC